MIYLPIEDFSQNACYYVYDKDTIRVYITQPVINGNSDYTDYFINSHYISKKGNQSWSSFSSLPVCTDTSEFTNNIYYRNDMPDILLMFLIICIFGFYLPLRIVLRWFKKL